MHLHRCMHLGTIRPNARKRSKTARMRRLSKNNHEDVSCGFDDLSRPIKRGAAGMKDTPEITIILLVGLLSLRCLTPPQVPLLIHSRMHLSINWYPIGQNTILILTEHNQSQGLLQPGPDIDIVGRLRGHLQMSRIFERFSRTFQRWFQKTSQICL